MLAPSDVALIFDFDNTLIHSTIDFQRIRRRLIDLLRGAGPAVDEHLTTLAIPELIERASANHPELAVRMWEVVVEEEDLGMAGAGAVEYAADVLQELDHRQYRLGLLTNNRRGSTLDLLSQLGVHGVFDAIATRDDVAKMKPLPDGVAHLLSRLPGVGRTYVIGDSWVDGLTAAAAGARFIGFGPREAEVRARAVPIWTWITDLRELLDLDLVGS